MTSVVHLTNAACQANARHRYAVAKNWVVIKKVALDKARAGVNDSHHSSKAKLRNIAWR